MQGKIFTHTPKPIFKTESERLRYWEKEKKRWLEGYSGIPGTLYHYIQEQWIKDRTSGKVLRPIARDVDLLIHEKIKEQRSKKRSLIVLKGRGMGLSSIGGALTNYFIRCYPGSTSLVTSKEQSAISTFFSEKIMVPFNNYDVDIRPTILNKNETKSSVYLKAQVKYKDDSGDIGIGESKVICRETTDKPSSATAFSGEGAIFGFYDEIALHRRRAELIKSSISCYRNSLTNQMDGFLLSGGTCEENLSNKDLAEFQTLVRDSDMWDADILFIPFWMGKFMDANGHSNEKAGLEWWEKEAEKLSKAEDKSLLLAHKKNNPRSLQDIFDFSVSNRWEEDVAEKIKIQYREVIKLNLPITKTKLIDIGGSIESNPSPNGNVYILEHPKPNIKYYLCVDGVATGKESGEEKGSNVAGTIIKMFDPDGDSYSPVCIYTERPNNVEQSYINLCSEARYYNRYNGLAGIMAEANAGTADHFALFLKNNNMSKFIMDRQDLSGKGYSNTKKAFQFVNKDVRDFQMRQANIFLRKHISSIKMVMLLEDMMKAESENADILDSWLMWFIAAKDYDQPVKLKKSNSITGYIASIKIINGKTQLVFEKKTT